MSGNGDGFTSAERNFLRMVERYAGNGGTVLAADVARGLGTSRQAVAMMAGTLEAYGLLTIRRLPKKVAYEVTDAGRAELAAHQVAYLLVEVDDRMAEEVTYYLAQNVNGVGTVTDHGEGCCCQHCPYKGGCR